MKLLRQRIEVDEHLLQENLKRVDVLSEVISATEGELDRTDGLEAKVVVRKALSGIKDELRNAPV